MFRLTRSHLQPIGLDIGHESIKMLQLEASGSYLSIHAASRKPMPADAPADAGGRMAVAMDIVRQTIRHDGFHGRGVVVSLPWDLLHTKNLRLPSMPPAELEAAALMEARNVFDFDIDAAAVRCIPAGEVRQGNEVRQEVILLAVKNPDIDHLLEQFHRIGLDVAALDIEPCALHRSVERFIRRREDEQAVHVLVDVGRRRSQVVIGRGREINFIKPLEMGGHQIHEAVARRLGITLEEAAALRNRLADDTGPNDARPIDARRDSVRQAVHDAARSVMEDLGREVALCLRYYSVTFRGHRPTRLRLVGGEANDPQLQQSLAAAMTIPVDIGRPLAGINTDRLKATDRRGPMSEWCVAVGLALRFTEGQFAPRVGSSADDPGQSPARAPSTVAEVVDLAAVAAAPDTLAEVGKTREAVHA